jgi:SET domain-containing protein
MSTIKSYRSPKTEVKENSRIQGKGLFAKEPIKKDEIVAIKTGHILTLKEFQKLPDELKQYCLQIEDNFFLGPKSKEEIEDNSIFINHSCEPNVGFNGQVTYVALKDIQPGEELTHDYAMCFTIDFHNYKCSCGSKNCRSVVSSGNEWKSEELRKKYGDYFAWFILKKIKSE